MKYCVHCGAEIHDEAVVCVKCGCSVEQPVPTPAKQDTENDTLDTVIKVFLIIGCIVQGWADPSSGLVFAYHHFDFQSYAGQKADWHRTEGVYLVIRKLGGRYLFVVQKRECITWI